MAVVFDKLLGPLSHSHVKVVVTDPASAENGDIILNSTNGYIRIWYLSAWFTIGQVAVQNKILMESGYGILSEDGHYILAEYNIPSNSSMQLEG